MAEQLPRGLLADPAVQRAMLLPVARRTFTDPGDDITEELSGLEFAAPGLLYDPMMGMAQTGAMLMGDMPADPNVMTQTMLDAPLIGGLLSAATGAVPRGAVLGANVLPSRLPQHLVPLTDDKLEFALPSTKYLVKKIREKAPDAELGLSLSENQVGKSNYLTLTHPNKQPIEIRLSDHSTGTRRLSDYAEMFSDSVPESGKPKFGQISRESFDKRIDEVLSYYDDGIELGANKAPTAALPGLLDDIRPARENMRTVIDSNTIGGRVVGDETVPIGLLSGGASTSAKAQKAIDDIADSMSGPEGFIERLIVNQDNNVIEGAHRLEALRKLGVDEVPVTRIVDPQALFTPDTKVAMKAAIQKAKKTNSDYENQIISQLGEMLADPDVAGDPKKVFEVYDPAKGFEDQFKAALKVIELGANPATAALPGLLQDRRRKPGRTPRNQNSFPMRSLLGQRVYTATMPDGSI